MEMPTPCDCGEVVEFDSMRTCHRCEKMNCRECHQSFSDYCENCREDMVECVECGDMVEKDKLEKKGRCYFCNETMI